MVRQGSLTPGGGQDLSRIFDNLIDGFHPFFPREYDP